MQNDDFVMVSFQLSLYKKISDLSKVSSSTVGFGVKKHPFPSPATLANQGKITLNAHILPVPRNYTCSQLYDRLDRECKKMVETYESAHDVSSRRMVGYPVVMYNNAEIEFVENLTVSALMGHQDTLSLTIHRAYPIISNMDRMIEFLLCTTIAERDDDGNQILRLTKSIIEEEKKESEPLKRLLGNLDLNAYFSTLSKMHLNLPFLCSLCEVDLKKALEETELPFGVRKRVEWAVLHIKGLSHPFRDEELHVRDAALKTIEEFDARATKKQVKLANGKDDTENKMEMGEEDMVECRSIFNCDAHFPALHSIAEFLIGSRFGVRRLVGRTGHFESTWTERRHSALRKTRPLNNARPAYDTVLITPDSFEADISKHYFAIQFVNFGT